MDLRRHTSEKVPHVLRPLDKSELARRLRCPDCHGPMDVHPYYGPGNAVIDSCGRCAFIWLDHGELTVIVIAPEREIRVRGRPSQNSRWTDGA